MLTRAGSGIFVNAGSMFRSTESTGVTLLLWLTGIIYAIAGVIVHIEYGLSVPRRLVHDQKVAIPRSGGDLNYLSYVYRVPAYAKDTVPFVATVFGICFIIFGTMAGNAMNFAIRVLRSANPENDYKTNDVHVRIVAIAISVLACFAHTVSRRGGIILNNVFAVVKVLILVLIIVTTIAYRAGAFPELKAGAPYDNIPSLESTENMNLDPQHSFADASHSVYDYSSAFLDVIFAFSGFEQANYVLGEIANPRRKLPIGLSVATGSIALLYLAVNVCYWVVIPQDVVKGGTNIAEAFFTITFGSLSHSPKILGRRISGAFMAVSALGNVIVMTYTATRVKQEIAKEGILPFPKFFAQNYDLSIGRALKHLQGGKGGSSWLGSSSRNKWFAAENFQEKTPVGAILLHLVTCVILIFGTWGMSANNAYALLTGTAAYLMNAFFGVLISVGLLYLRFRESVHWNEKSSIKRPVISVTAAFVFLILNLLPVILNWYKNPSPNPGDLGWYMKALLSWVVVGVGALWWLGFFILARRKDKKTNTVLTIEKVPEYEEDPEGSGQYVQKHETTYICRKGRDFAFGDFPQDDFEAMRSKITKNGPVAAIRSDFDDP
jgi:amino acid transporter